MSDSIEQRRAAIAEKEAELARHPSFEDMDQQLWGRRLGLSRLLALGGAVMTVPSAVLAAEAIEHDSPEVVILAGGLAAGALAVSAAGIYAGRKYKKLRREIYQTEPLD